MSVLDDVLDWAETNWRLSQLAHGALPTGEDGFERDVRIPDQLITDPADGTVQVPHVFAHDPVANVDPLLWGQMQSTVRIRFDLVAPESETQAEVDTRLQAFRALVAADPTLGGIVRTAWCSTWGVIDSKAMQGSRFREGRAVLSAVFVE